MKAERVRAIAAYSATTIASTIYLPTLIEISEENGFWYMLPVWLTLVIGVVAISEWLRNITRPKSHPSFELVDEHYPRPSVKAYDWDTPFEATDRTIGEAFDSASKGQNKGLVVFAEDWSTLSLEWEKEGWVVKWQPEDERVTRLAVPLDSKWLDREVKDSSMADIFRRMPKGHVDDATAIRLVASFLDWEEPPSNVGWATMRHANPSE